MISRLSFFPAYCLRTLVACFLILFVICPLVLAQEDSPEAFFRRGTLQFEQNRYVPARLDFSQVTERYPDSPWAPAAIMMLSKTYFSMGDVAEARAMAKSLPQEYPESKYAEWAPYMIAACDFRTGDTSSALEALAKLASNTLNDDIRTRSLSAIRNTILPLTGSSTVIAALEAAGIPAEALESIPENDAPQQLTNTAQLFQQPETSWEHSDALRVGLLTPLTGINADLGVQLMSGVESVFNRYKEIHGTDLELIIEDTCSDPITAILKTRELIDDGVLAIIGPVMSEESFGPAAIAEEHGIPFLAPTTTDPDFTRLGRNVYQLNFNPVVQARALADFAASMLELNSYAVIASDDSWGEAVTDAFIENMSRYGASLIHSGYYKVDNPSDNDELLMRIRERAPDSESVIDSVVVLNPGSAFPDTLYVRQNDTVRGEQMLGPINSIDCVFISATSDHAALIASQLMAYHINTVILGDNGWWSNEQALRLGSQYIDNSFVVAPIGELSGGDGETAITGGLSPGFASQVPVLRGGDAARVLIHCFERGVSDPGRLTEMLNTIENLKGFASRITLDPVNRMNTAIDFIRIRNGYYEPIDLTEIDRIRDEVRVHFFEMRFEQSEQDIME